MFPRPALVLILFLTTVLSACQSYTTGIQQTATRADEAAAISTLRTIATAQRTYSLSNSGEFGTLQQLTDGGFLDVRFSNGKPIKDYVLTLNVTPKTEGAPEGFYSCNADPEKPAERAGRHFYIDSTSNVIRVNDTQPASAADQVVE